MRTFDWTATKLNGPVVQIQGWFYGWRGTIVVRPEGTVYSGQGKPGADVLKMAQTVAADVLARADALDTPNTEGTA